MSPGLKINQGLFNINSQPVSAEMSFRAIIFRKYVFLGYRQSAHEFNFAHPSFYKLRKAKRMETNKIPNLLWGDLRTELATYHQQLVIKYSEPHRAKIPTNPYTKKLMPFNGYYTLDNCPGAFFAVDTNMVVSANSPEPLYDLTFVISLDGKTAARFPFTGTFDGIHLNQQTNIGGLNLNISFTRNEEVQGRVANCSGSITLPGARSSVAVSGYTYNNPIPASLFTGEYYYGEGATKVKVMSIGNNNQLLYDNGSNDGVLKPVSTYVYNMNMYYFSFTDAAKEVRLIMGTASVNGFACNNMTVAGSKVTSRSLLTIPNAVQPKFELYDLGNCNLADFSGYYQTPTPDHPLAFVSIQAQYVTLLPDKSYDLYFIMISVSLDGLSSEGYYYNPFTMSFDGELLNMPKQGIALKLTRGYNPVDGSLISLTGTVNGAEVNGNTLFNPVPLSAFGGVSMTNDKGDVLTVNNDNSVTYNGKKMDNIIYVPLMYILAYPADKPTTVMSFGTAGSHGNACIVTQAISTVYAIQTEK